MKVLSVLLNKLGIPFKNQFLIYVKYIQNLHKIENVDYSDTECIEPYQGIQYNSVEEIELTRQPAPYTLLESAQNAFIVKTYSVLGIQLLVTAIFVWATISSIYLQQFLIRNILSVFFIMLFTAAAIVALLLCKKEICERFPQNMIALSIFTLAFSYCVATICARYEPESIAIVAAITAACTVSITLYVKLSKSAFSTTKQIMGSLGVSFLSALLVLSILNSIFYISYFSLFMSLSLAILFSVYLIYDTKMILDSDKHHLNFDQYVLASLFLYVDIIEIFLQIMGAVGKRR